MTEDEAWDLFPGKLDEEKVPPQLRSAGCVLPAPETMTWDQAISLVSKRYGEAKKKHPDYAHGAYNAYQVIVDEVLELRHAVGHEPRERQIDEALDVIVTCLRFVMGEHDWHVAGCLK